MTRAALKRWSILGAVAVLLAGAASFLPLPILRPGMERALARRLGRRVDIGEVSLSLLGGPGFSLSGVTIHEDPRAGIEPFVYAQTVEARVDLLGLLAGRRGFSSLRFGDATLNLVRTRTGEWNLQYLLNARLSDVPSIHLRGARVNLKFEQTKSVVYFDDADVDISAGDRGALDLRFSGAPARTDRPAQNFGHLFVRGSWIPTSADRPLTLKVELEPSSLDGFAKLFGRSWFDLQGQISLNAQLAGPPSQLAVLGEVQLDEGRRSDFLPSRDGKWNVPYRGMLDLMGERLQLENTPDATPPKGKGDASVPPFAARLEASDLLTSPQWRASIELNDAPLAGLADAARRIGAPLPAQLSVEGTVSGELKYEAESGATGNLETRDATLTLPDSPAVRSARVPITIDAQTIVVGPCTVSLNVPVPEENAGEKAGEKSVDGQSALVEASYKFDGSAAAEFKITTGGLDLGGLSTFGSVPLLRQAAVDPSVRSRGVPNRQAKATWRGSIRYQRSGGHQRSDADEGTWTGDYSVENARIPVDGIADPIRILSANVSVGDGRLAVTKIRAKAGDIAFTGDYHWDSEAGDSEAGDSKGGDSKGDGAHKFKLQVGEATLAELDRLFKPTLMRDGGFLQRTLRLGSASPAPDWLAQRKAEGTLSIAALIAGDHRIAVDSARVVWDGASVRVSAIDGRVLSFNSSFHSSPNSSNSSFHSDSSVEGPSFNSASISPASNSPALKGELSVDLTEGAPQYRLTGKVGGVAYKGGRLDFEGRIEAEGDGLPLLAGLRATGALSGRSIAFSSDADFHHVTGNFQASLQGTSLRWKFTDLLVTQGSDVYVGEGAAQADGKIVLDLMNRGKQVRYTGSLVSLAAQP